MNKKKGACKTSFSERRQKPAAPQLIENLRIQMREGRGTPRSLRFCRILQNESISIGFISLGCSKNLVDSQLMAGNLLEGNFKLAPSPEEADVIIVNTCAFIGAAREEADSAVKDACRLKKRGACRAVVVTGCLPQRYRGELAAKYPLVDAFAGVDEVDRICEVVRKTVAGGEERVMVSEKPEKILEPASSTPVFSDGAYAYLKIADGCNHPCTFCAIPGIRGRYRSRTAVSIRKEAERLLESGFRELVLVSQDTTFYGRDLGDGTDIAKLLRTLDGFGGEYRVRMLYAFPPLVDDALLETVAGSRHICRYFDVPIQHSHPEILAAMKRAGTAGAVAGVHGRIRGMMPDAVLRTTCLVGFPGEREAHFGHLMEHISDVRYDHLGVFVYSPEEGTAACGFKRRPTRRISEGRKRRMLERQRKIVQEKAAARIGERVRLLVEKPVDRERGIWVCRSSGQAPEVDGATFAFLKPGSVKAGVFTDAVYTGWKDYDMYAEQV